MAAVGRKCASVRPSAQCLWYYENNLTKEKSYDRFYTTLLGRWWRYGGV